jgi:hypothetical protein
LETQTNTLNLGVLSTHLGSVTSLSGVDLDRDLWLGISVGGDAEMRPRIRIPGQRFGVPRGGIIMWSGSQVPAGWALCDGSQGTPNLSGRFVVATGTNAISGSVYSIGQAGGNETHDHGGATAPHVLTVEQMPSHKHESWGEAFPDLAPWGAGRGPGNLGSSNSDRDNYFYFTSPVGGDQPHSHGIGASTNLPPFYALAFIMKL